MIKRIHEKLSLKAGYSMINIESRGCGEMNHDILVQIQKISRVAPHFSLETPYLLFRYLETATKIKVFLDLIVNVIKKKRRVLIHSYR